MILNKLIYSFIHYIQTLLNVVDMPYRYNSWSPKELKVEQKKEAARASIKNPLGSRAYALILTKAPVACVHREHSSFNAPSGKTNFLGEIMVG